MSSSPTSPDWYTGGQCSSVTTTSVSVVLPSLVTLITYWTVDPAVVTKGTAGALSTVRCAPLATATMTSSSSVTGVSCGSVASAVTVLVTTPASMSSCVTV